MASYQKGITLEVQTRHHEVTGSCIYTTITYPNGEKFKFIVDVGLFQDEESEFLNRYLDFDISEIDHIFLTHNQVDHIGGVPACVKNGFSGNFYTTTKTRELLPIALFDSALIEELDSRQKKLQPFFNENDVINSLKLVKAYNFLDTFKISDNIDVTFIENGHLAGSAMILFRIKYKSERLNVLFTGDYSSSNYFFIPKKIPKWIKKLENLVIVTESTYGTTLSTDINKTFDEDIPKIIDSGKSILIPCIAQERYEVILAHLKTLQDERKIGKNIPIYLDGNLAIKYLRKFTGFYGEIFLPENINYVSENDNREEIISAPYQKIILTTSGMCSNGPAQTYLAHIIDNNSWATYFTCYQASETIGKKIIETNSGCKINIFGKETRLEMDIYSTSEFSSHAKQDELIDLLSSFNNISAILINHGDSEVKEAFREKLEELEICSCIKVLDRTRYYVLDKYGLIKEHNTKFVMSERSIQPSSSFKKNAEKTTNRRPVNTRTKFKVYAQTKLNYREFYGT